MSDSSVHPRFEAAVLAYIAGVVNDESFGLRNDGVAGGTYYRDARRMVDVHQTK